jgi:hypothetical protein
VTFGGSWRHLRVTDSATRPGQRLLPLAALGHRRPIANAGPANGLAGNLTVAPDDDIDVELEA